MPLQGFAAWALAGLISATAPAARPDAAGDQDDTPRTLTAEQIVEKNVAARHFEKPNAPHGRGAPPGVHSEFRSAHRPFMDHMLLSLNMARSAMALY